jgi:hypothetical protein
VIQLGSEPVPTRYKLIGTTGGPHLLLAEELLSYWRGTEGWHDHRDPSDNSDFARACRVNSWLGLIPCHTGQALVLSGDVGMIAWIPGNQGGMLVQWIGINDEANIADALGSRELANVLDNAAAEQIVFSTPSSGVLRLFDAADRGDMLHSSEVLRLAPGDYCVQAGYLETPGLMIVVRRFPPI